MKKWFVGLLFVLIGFGQAAWARSITIECPVRNVRADVSTKLPKDWWYTPTVGELRSVRMQTIAGESTLVCLYQAFDGQVAVMRKVPSKARECRADSGSRRFICTAGR